MCTDVCVDPHTGPLHRHTHIKICPRTGTCTDTRADACAGMRADMRGADLALRLHGCPDDARHVGDIPVLVEPWRCCKGPIISEVVVACDN